MLYILSKDERLVSVLSNENPDACPFFDAEHTERLNGESIFEFSVPGSHADSQYVVEENLVAFRDLDGDFQLFIIKTIEETHDEGKTKRALCEHAALELLDDVIRSAAANGVSAFAALDTALSGTRWQVGTVDSLGAHLATFRNAAVLSAITQIADTWGGELRYRVTITDKVAARYVDLLARRGSDTGKRFEYTKDIQRITRTVDSSNVKTAMYGLGVSSKDTSGHETRLTFADVAWSVGNGDPVDKPVGQEWVGDSAAMATYGRVNGDGSKRHRFGFYEDGEQADAALLLRKTWDALQKQVTPLVQYGLTVIDLEAVSGYDHEAVRLGDTVHVLDREFVPALAVTARVIEIIRRLDEPEQAKITLGNFLPSLTSEAGRLGKVEQTLGDKTGVWDSASDGPIATSRLEGIIDTLQTEVRAGQGNVTITDNNGILITDSATAPTKALRLLGGTFAIANSKDAATGDWNWRTFGTGDGFAADLITTGLLDAARIRIGAASTYEAGYNPTTKIGIGQTIDVSQNKIQRSSSFYWDQWGLIAKDTANQNKQVKLMAGGLFLSTDGGQTDKTAITADGIKAEAITAGVIKGVTIEGGSISSGSTINVTTDLTVGNNIYVGDLGSTGAKSLRFSGGLNITKPDGQEALMVSSPWTQIRHGQIYLGESSPGVYPPAPQATSYNTWSLYQMNAPWQSALSVQITATQTLSAAVWTRINTWGDSGIQQSAAYGEWDKVSQRFTVASSTGSSDYLGVYLVVGSLRWQTVADGTTLIISLYKNGSEYARLAQLQAGTASANIHTVGTTVAFAKPGDYFEIYAYTSNSATDAITTTGSYWKMWKVA